jgi:hypothetical protein
VQGNSKDGLKRKSHTIFTFFDESKGACESMAIIGIPSKRENRRQNLNAKRRVKDADAVLRA